VLVIGTPTLLILGKEMPEIMSNLLALSIIANTINLICFKQIIQTKYNSRKRNFKYIFYIFFTWNFLWNNHN